MGEEHKAVLSTVTIFCLNLCALGSCFVDLLRNRFRSCLRSLGPNAFFRLFVIVACGIASGLGGVLCTYAFTQAKKDTSALIALTESGVYTVATAVFIAIVFRERPTV